VEILTPTCPYVLFTSARNAADEKIIVFFKMSDKFFDLNKGNGVAFIHLNK